MYKTIFLLTSFVLLYSCGKTQKEEQNTFLKGFFPNVKDNFIVLYENETPIDTAFIDQNKNFSIKLALEKPLLLHFEIDQFYQYVFLEPSDSLVISANLLNFHESLSFSGKGSAVNNFILNEFSFFRNDLPSLNASNLLEPSDYKAKIDEIKEKSLKNYDLFIKENPNLSKEAQNIALVSTLFPLYKEMEAYPFVYQLITGKSIINRLEASFYDYRNEISFNDCSLKYYRPYYSYMTMFINNLALKKYETKNANGDINKDERFHIKKLKIIDSIFSEKKLKDNLFRNAAYSYIFNIQNSNKQSCYIEEFEKYNQNNSHKTELETLFSRTLALNQGSLLPDFQVISKEKKNILFSEIEKPSVAVIYFWSVNQEEISSLILNRVLQLKSIFPEFTFIGIEVSEDTYNWENTVPKLLLDNQYHANDFTDLSRKLLINNINKAIVLEPNGRIISAFETIFSPNIEKILVKN